MRVSPHTGSSLSNAPRGTRPSRDLGRCCDRGPARPSTARYRVGRAGGLTLLIGIPMGLLVALARLSAFRPLSLAAAVYAEVIRGTPLLMQIFVICFVLPA